MAPVLAKHLSADRSFERLYRKHAGDVYRYALVVLRNQADAEDVTQTTFLNAYRAMENGERPRSPQNWLIAIAHNVCRQRFRQSQRRPNEVSYEEELAEAVVDEDAVSAEDIRRALGHLAFNQRSALVMRELEGRSYQEIADILGTTVSAVETLIFRARRALREQLEEGITCREAELAISKQLDGRLSRKEKGQLRAHLRECAECAAFARSQRAHRGALKALGAIPLPGSLAGLFGSGGATVGGGLAFKAAAVAAGAALATGVSYEGVKHGLVRSGHATPSAAPRHQAPVTHARAVIKASPKAALAALPSREQKLDQKPFRRAAVKARARTHKAHPNRGNHFGTTRQTTLAQTHASSSSSHGRSHQAKPAKVHKPQHPQAPKVHRTQKPRAATHTNRGHQSSPPKSQNHQSPPAGGKKADHPPAAQSNAAASGSHGNSGH